MLALPSSCASCLLLVGCGYVLRNTRILSRSDGQAGLQIALSVTLPAFIYQSLTHGGVLLGSCFVAAIAGILYVLVCALSSWVVFRKRAPRERAQLCGLALGAEVPTLAMAWIACMWSVAGVEAAAVFACVNIVAEQLLSFLCFGSSGPGNPRAYRHADGGVYDGEWSGMQKHGAGVYRYPNGDRYEGDWRDNLKDGRGVYYYADGGKFEGEFVKGERDGLGLRTWPSGVVKAGEFRKGALQRQLPPLECGTTLLRVKEAAQAARAVRVGGDSPLDAFRQPSLYPPLLGLWGAFAVLLSGWQAPEWLQLSTSILGGLHIPLALLAFGAALRPVGVERRSAKDVISVLSVRLLAGLSVSVILLVLTPQLLPYAIRSAAVVVCLLAPISQKALQYAQDFKLNERLCEGAVAASLVASNLLIVAFTGFAFLNDVVPISALKGVVQISTEPLTKVCLVMLGIAALFAWLAPWFVEQQLSKSNHARVTAQAATASTTTALGNSSAVTVASAIFDANGHGSKEVANGNAAGEQGTAPSVEGIEFGRGSAGAAALPDASRAVPHRWGSAMLRRPVFRAPGRAGHSRRVVSQGSVANVVQLTQPRALRRGVSAPRVCAVVTPCLKPARHIKLAV